MPDEAGFDNALLTEYQVTQHYIDMIERARWNATAVISAPW